MAVQIVYHPEVITKDIPALLNICESNGEATILLSQIEKAKHEIIQGYGVPRDEMDPPYRGWYRKKTHSRAKVPDGVRPDLRIIYQWASENSQLRILAIGRRIPRDPTDIYSSTSNRDQVF